MLSAQVIQHEILEAYPDIPVNVSAIAGELDPECYGLSASRNVAKAIFRLPNVEPSSHTYSHPLFWGYFKDYDPAKEMPILDKYPPKLYQRTLLTSLFGDAHKTGWEKYLEAHPDQHDKREDAFERLFNRKAQGELSRFSYYETPRSYACGPYDLEREIKGSMAYIKSISPKEKRDKIRLVQWSGDTSPYEGALREVRQAGLLGINGGDSRYDSEYPSYASVAPIGAQIGREFQIYSSNSNENTYTNLWTDRFFGFIYLQTTVQNTEIPMRVQPFNIYYHMFSGEKEASLAALISNMEFARHQNLVRIFASDFAEIAQGFYSVHLVKEGAGSWRILNRGKLNTVRVDKAVLKTVDFTRSEGVLGQRYFQGSLYVSLDPDVDAPLVSLKQKNTENLYEAAVKPYIIYSNWLTNGLISVKKSLMFAAHGYGDGKVSVKFPEAGGEYDVVVKQKKKELLSKVVTGNADGIVSFTLAVNATNPVSISITARQATK